MLQSYRGSLNWNKFQYQIKEKFVTVHIDVPPAFPHIKDWANVQTLPIYFCEGWTTAILPGMWKWMEEARIKCTHAHKQ